MTVRQRLGSVRALWARLRAAGFDEANVARWFGVPLATDARFVRPPPERPRRGLGGWIALWIAGEAVELAALRPAPSAAELAALAALGLAEEEGAIVRPRAAVWPWRGLLVASPAAEAFDVSALNVAASLPMVPSLWDIGCGAGLLSMAAARAGVAVWASDLDAGLVEWTRLNAALAELAVETAVGDLWAAAPPGRRFEAVVFNAPLLRAPLAVSDAPPRYSAGPRGEALALAFLDGVGARVAPGGRVLLHAQLTPAVDAALDGWAARAAVAGVVFAHAPDGTPHALTELRLDGPPGRRRARVPLSPACPHLSRAILDAVAAPGRLDDAATPLPAPWLELRTSARYDDGRRTLRVTFGGVAVDDEELALLDRLDGRALGALGPSPADRERLEALVARGLVILR